MKSIIRIALLGCFQIALFAGCSTSRNTQTTRAYHELTTRYNVYFNAEESYNETLNSIFDSYKDNFNELLPMYPNSSAEGDTIVKNTGGAFDRVIEKTTKAIQEHSISAKPIRDVAKMNSQEYRDWLRQSEFNPFIDRAWLLMGKAHLQNKDYEEAIAVLSQTTRLFSNDIDVISEAQIWMMRAYAEMGWLSDAKTIAATLEARSLPVGLRPLYAESNTFLLLKQKKYADAIPFLHMTIENEKNKSQKRRLQFLLGQLYTLLDDKGNAFKSFEKLKGLSVPYEIKFSAIMAQSQVVEDNQTIIGNLQKMTKSRKNAETLDQIYFAIGNIYYSQNNLEKAVENYLLAEKKSTRNGIEKALAQIAIGDIYFNKKEFVKAEPRYSSAASVLPRDNDAFSKVEFRSKVLAELVPHIVAVEQQDSLQQLARLPLSEQLKIIHTHIAELKKKEREETTATRRAESVAAQQAIIPGVNREHSVAESTALLMNRETDGLFYFYNQQLVAQGKNEFRKRWGNRNLDDNWRLLSKIGRTDNASSDNSKVGSTNIESADSLNTALQQEQNFDPYSPEFYFQQLPVSEEALNASNLIIETGLLNIGNIAKDRLYDLEYAIAAFNRLLTDFPECDEKKEVYHQLYLIYMRLDNKELAQSFKSKIIDEFPESSYAVAFTNPEYESVMQNFSQAEDMLYQETYRAYKQGNTDVVHNNYEKARSLFHNGSLLPKFMLLEALSYANVGDADKLRIALTELTKTYPDGEETVLAQNILNGLDEGKMLATNATAISGIEWKNSLTPSNRLNAVDSIQFDRERNSPHNYILLFNPSSQSKNELLFAVSDYNFSNFQQRTFPLSFIRISSADALKISSFRSFEETLRYASMIESDSIFRNNIKGVINPVIISDVNFENLQIGKSIEEYLAFYNTVLLGDTVPVDSIAIDTFRTIVPIKEKDVRAEIEVPHEQIIEAKSVVDYEKPPLNKPRMTLEQQHAELERKTEEALSQNSNLMTDKERKAILADRESERKRLIKQRQEELKQKEKLRSLEIKRREKERRMKLKEQEKMRKEKLKERNRVLKEQNR